MRVATLWIGKSLGLLEQLCLKSFADIGQKPLVYSYEPIKNLPSYVDSADASEIFPGKPLFRDPVKNSPAVHADLFRLHLMTKTDHIWVDADAYAIRPFETRNGYLIGGVAPKRRRIKNGVVRLPKESPALENMLDFVSSPECLPPWWGPKKCSAFRMIYGTSPTLKTLPLGAIGPEMFHYFMWQSGEIDMVLEDKELYALPFSTMSDWLAKPMDELEAPEWESKMSVHFFASFFRRRLRNFAKRGHIHPESLFAVLARKHDIPLPEDWFSRNIRVSQS